MGDGCCSGAPVCTVVFRRVPSRGAGLRGRHGQALAEVDAFPIPDDYLSRVVPLTKSRLDYPVDVVFPDGSTLEPEALFP